MFGLEKNGMTVSDWQRQIAFQFYDCVQHMKCKSDVVVLQGLRASVGISECDNYINVQDVLVILISDVN